MTTVARQNIAHHAPIDTWLGVGGVADHFATPRSRDDVCELVREYAGQSIRVVGDGANLLIHDAGVDGLVVSLAKLREVLIVGTTPGGEESVILRVGAGVNLPKLITKTVRDGLSGLEVLAGIPASVGGAVRMNAGGAFGSMSEVVHAVEAVNPLGEVVRFEHEQLNFAYRHCNLDASLIFTQIELALTPVSTDEQPKLRQRLKDVMAYKKQSQPMAESSAGCAFRNPIVGDVRHSAGKLIDDAGCKGLRSGGAQVSHQHANFIVTGVDCTAGDVIELMRKVRTRVFEHHGVELEPEVVVWSRAGEEAVL